MDSLFTSAGGSFLAFAFVIMVIVFIHEYGHFWVARRCGVKIKTFSVGFGKPLKTWVDRHGTKWIIALIPLGGYVAFDEGDIPLTDVVARQAIPEEEKRHMFSFKPLWQRSLIVVAGPVANFILAIFIFSMIFTFVGQKVMTPVVEAVKINSSAERAGFKVNDRIISINNKNIIHLNDLTRIVSSNPQKTLTFGVLREEQFLSLEAVPDLVEQKSRFNKMFQIGRLGITSSKPENISSKRYNFFTSVVLGIKETKYIVSESLSALKGIILGKESSDALGGPLQIAQMSGKMASLGITALFNLIAVLSVSIGLLNLFPIPMLDGGHLLFYVYEFIMRRPLPIIFQEWFTRIGLSLLLLLFVWVTWNDLGRLDLFS